MFIISHKIILVLFVLINRISCKSIDNLGYVIYCPCMGRFGNQADHFLGALAFAHGLNRTLVLPPWVEYRYGESRSVQVPFDRYFQVKPLEKYHKVITMENFMKDVAPDVWPTDKRISFCYTSRGNGDGCNAKEGNPFGPFWDTFSIDFVRSEMYGPLHYDVHNHNMASEWENKYSPGKWPVLAFTGAPASFPVQDENRALQKYLIWSDEVTNKAKEFIENVLPKGAFIGIHLRNGVDWVRACKHVPDSPNLFAAPQCLGQMNEHGKATTEMCLPTKDIIVRQLKRVVKYYNGFGDKNKEMRSIFVASDNYHMIDELSSALKRMKLQIFKTNTNDPHLDLAILGRSNHFVGNCISTFSAFVKRERDARGFPSSFWAFPVEKNVNSIYHEEL